MKDVIDNHFKIFNCLRLWYGPYPSQKGGTECDTYLPVKEDANVKESRGLIHT